MSVSLDAGHFEGDYVRQGARSVSQDDRAFRMFGGGGMEILLIVVAVLFGLACLAVILGHRRP